MPEETETPVFEPIELTIDPAVGPVAAVTITADPVERGYYVFAAYDATGKEIAPAMTAQPAADASATNAEADIRAGLEAQYTYDIEAARSRKEAEIAAACRAEYTAPLTTSYGAVFWTDPETLLDVMNIIEMLAPAEIFSGYKGADDVWRDLTREEFQLAIQEGAQRKTAAFAKRKTLIDQIAAATNQAELDAISW